MLATSTANKRDYGSVVYAKLLANGRRAAARRNIHFHNNPRCLSSVRQAVIPLAFRLPNHE